MAGHQLGQAARYSVHTDKAHQPTGSRPLPSESHHQVRGHLPAGAAGRDASPPAATFTSHWHPRTHVISPPFEAGMHSSTQHLLAL